ncbi:MAG: hypothetical protein WCB05_19555 [Candidatus Sulfotelmatobacter sp.]|jgi:hypothetical protein
MFSEMGTFREPVSPGLAGVPPASLSRATKFVTAIVRGRRSDWVRFAFRGHASLVIAFG